jgi:hypothetical protein
MCKRVKREKKRTRESHDGAQGVRAHRLENVKRRQGRKTRDVDRSEANQCRHVSDFHGCVDAVGAFKKTSSKLSGGQKQPNGIVNTICT